MNTKYIIQKTTDYVKDTLMGESSGHDWWHVFRVWKIATNICKVENADLLIVELSALLHDIGDWKFYDGDVFVGPRMAKEWLSQFDMDEDIINKIAFIISNMSSRSLIEDTADLCLEGKIVQDADRLDAMGAMGIARTFAYGGKKSKVLYDPRIKPQKFKTFTDYINNTSPSINHFYEKLLLLKNEMHTDFAKKLAIGRHDFLEQFLDRFLKEWEGEQ